MWNWELHHWIHRSNLQINKHTRTHVPRLVWWHTRTHAHDSMPCVAFSHIYNARTYVCMPRHCRPPRVRAHAFCIACLTLRAYVRHKTNDWMMTTATIPLLCVRIICRRCVGCPSGRCLFLFHFHFIFLRMLFLSSMRFWCATSVTA